MDDLKLEDLKNLAAQHPRKVIPPRVDVRKKTPALKQETESAVKRVIAEHRAVLAALKKR